MSVLTINNNNNNSSSNDSNNNHGPAPRDTRLSAQLTPRAVIAGLAVGGLMCFSNMYFGLQTGWVTMGSLQSTLLGFGLMKGLEKLSERQRSAVGVRWFGGFTALENVVVQTTAVATATMPLAGGFVGILPALECLPPSVSEESVSFSWPSQMLWTAALCFFGVFFAVPLRRQVILREKLRFPSGTATAQMLVVLHNMAHDEIDPELHTGGLEDVPFNSSASEDESVLKSVASANSSYNSDSASSMDGRAATDTIIDDESDWIQQGILAQTHEDDESWGKKWKALFWAFGASSAFAVVSYFMPILSSIPIMTWLGLPQATAFSWTLTPSLSYVGQGMIMGHRVGFSMLAGAIFGWALLGPIAKAKEWAPGPINNWEIGAKGWILWISLSIMLAESLASLLLLVGQAAWKAWRRRRISQEYERVVEPSVRTKGGQADTKSNKPVRKSAASSPPNVRRRTNVRSSDDSVLQQISVEATDEAVDPTHRHERVPATWWSVGLIISSSFCVVALMTLLQMPWYEPIVAILISLLVSVLAVRALGETDLNPVSGVGKVSQIAFALISPGKVIANLVAGAVAEAGAQQAGDLMQDLKTGHLVRASPRAQFFAQLIGSACSVVFTVAAFALYTSAYPLGGSMFPVPTARVWLDMARLLSGQAGLPSSVLPFCIVSAVVSAAVSAVHVLWPTQRIATFLPSGIAFAIAMYVTPNWTIPRVVGATLQYVWLRRSPESFKKYMVVVASGLVLGEGVMSIITAIFSTLSVPKWCPDMGDFVVPGCGGSSDAWCSKA